MTKVFVPDFTGDLQEVDTSSLQWRPSAYTVVIKDNTVLAIKYKDGRYDLPGGGIEYGEMPAEAAVREAKEETGVTIADPQLVDVKSTFYRTADGINHQTIMMYYVATQSEDAVIEPVLDPFEAEHIEGPVWLPLELLPDVETASTVDWRDVVTAHLQ